MPKRLLLVFVMAALVSGAGSIDRQQRIAVVAPEPYDGLVMLDQPVESQATRAGAIVVATATALKAARTARSVETTVSLDVEKYLKGTGPDTLTMKLPGGSAGGYNVAVGGVPNFAEGERVVLLLTGTSNPQLISLWQSKYTLVGTEARQAEGRKVSVKELEDKLGGALKKTVTIPINEDAGVIVSNYTTSCPAWPVSACL
jgi:hypothetical protein